MNRNTVLIADDLPLLVDALTDLLGADPSIVVVGTANDAVAAVEEAATARPDVALLDVRMPAGCRPAQRSSRCPRISILPR